MPDGFPDEKSNAYLRTGFAHEFQGNKADAFQAYKAVLDSEQPHLLDSRGAFTKIVELQSSQVVDWAVHCNWLNNKALAIDLRGKTEEKQELQDFAAVIGSIADRVADIKKLPWNDTEKKWEN